MAFPVRALLLIIFAIYIFTSLFNSDDLSYRDGILECVTQSITTLDLADETIIESLVYSALLSLSRDKSDDDGLSSNHLVLATSVLTGPLANLFTAALRHGYMHAYFAN